MRPQNVIFIAANPALGTIFQFETFKIGTVNEPSRPPIEWADGKALNGARALKRLGGEPTVVFLRGGATGARLLELLQEESIASVFVNLDNDTRQHHIFLSHNPREMIETEVLLPGPAVSREQTVELLRIACEVCVTAKECVIAGSLPPGIPDNFYQRLIAAVKSSSNCKVALDSRGAALAKALFAGPDILKINEDEFRALAGLRPSSSKEEMFERIKQIGQCHGISRIIVTRGGASVLAWSNSEGSLEVAPPTVEIVNRVGAGDSFLSGLVASIEDSFLESTSLAVAAGTANLNTLIPGDIDRRAVEALRDMVHAGHSKPAPS